MSQPVPLAPPRKLIDLEIDGATVRVPEGDTILDACRAAGRRHAHPLLRGEPDAAERLPGLCRRGRGRRTLVPACSRTAEAGMKVRTDTERVQHSRKLVMELLASSVEMDLTSPDVHRWMEEYGDEPRAVRRRDGRAAGGGAGRARTRPSPPPDDPTVAEGVYQPVKIDNELYVRDYSRCILCYKCVEACGVDAQNTFAIAVAGRGFDARISTEYAVGLDESACVYCGNCIGVCPTGALMFTSEHECREAGTWERGRADRHEHDLPVLRRRLRARAARAGQRDREGDLARGPLRHERAPVREGSVRLPVRAEPRAPARAGRSVVNTEALV